MHDVHLNTQIKRSPGQGFFCANRGKEAALPLLKRIFAAAHELYHIYCYFEGYDSALLQFGSILASGIIDEDAKEMEGMEANAFAAILLVLKERLDEQTDVYNLSYKDISVQTVLKIMDIFAIPYKAAVLRLLEEEKIEQVTEEETRKQIELTGKVARWQEIPKDFISFGKPNIN